MEEPQKSKETNGPGVVRAEGGQGQLPLAEHGTGRVHLRFLRRFSPNWAPQRCSFPHGEELEGGNMELTG